MDAWSSAITLLLVGAARAAVGVAVAVAVAERTLLLALLCVLINFTGAATNLLLLLRLLPQRQ